MAKGVEDTTFYRWHRLIALNEVGGDPARSRRPGPDRLDAWAVRQASTTRAGMTALSTHDTKRDEDVRARLVPRREDIDRWTRLWTLVHAAGRSSPASTRPTAYLLMQTLVGAWPISEERLLELRREGRSRGEGAHDLDASPTWSTSAALADLVRDAAGPTVGHDGRHSWVRRPRSREPRAADLAPSWSS